MKQKLGLAAALQGDPDLLILDEPTTSLDLRAAGELRDILRKLAAAGIGIVMVTHHLPDIIPEMRRVILLRGGRVFFDGPPEEALNASTLTGLFGIPLEVVERGGRRCIL